MIAVWFSNGAPSACAAKLTVERFGAANVRVLNNPVLEEDSDNLRFAADVAEWIGVKVERITAKDYPKASAKDVWHRRKAMAFRKGAPCTTHLKKWARQEWEKENKASWHVFGFTLEEQKRHDRFVLTERENVIPVLIDAGMNRQNCFDMVQQAGIALPRAYSWGLPNANCIGCVKATSPTYWNLIRKVAPDVFADRAAQSRQLGCKLARHKGHRIYLDQLPVEASGRKLKFMPDCGIHCEEKP